jgi:hypothetical protein
MSGIRHIELMVPTVPAYTLSLGTTFAPIGARFRIKGYVCLHPFQGEPMVEAPEIIQMNIDRHRVIPA